MPDSGTLLVAMLGIFMLGMVFGAMVGAASERREGVENGAKYVADPKTGKVRLTWRNPDEDC
jgi:hypothetical protein